jgi:hypothetical protein
MSSNTISVETKVSELVLLYFMETKSKFENIHFNTKEALYCITDIKNDEINEAVINVPPVPTLLNT